MARGCLPSADGTADYFSEFPRPSGLLRYVGEVFEWTDLITGFANCVGCFFTNIRTCVIEV